ncbi:MAG: trypsin-like peptidase domain-containing protein [Candidatus Hydrogenedentes bacterium]|nr:trypsin-like peptidase domain-containing protein [Candidatus Hydrogenedentota bacterium]
MRNSSTITLLLLGALALFCAIPGWAGEKPAHKPGGRTEIGGTPWKPQADQPGKVVYGTDDRRDVFEETDADRRALADSTCALVDASNLTEAEDGTFALQTYDYDYYGFEPCEGEPFASQPVAAYCTAFVVGPDLIATAGHCYSDSDLPYARFVFGFRMIDGETPRTTFDADEVYTGVEVVARQLEGDFDYAVIRVDRPIVAPGARILRLRGAGTIPEGTRVGVIGHPAGLPTKIAFGDNSVVRASDEVGYFVTNLDTFGGNSGSPVFNADTGLVEGILVRGEEDFELDGDCFRSRVLEDDAGFGEDVSKAATFARFAQAGRGTLSLDQAAYQCADTVALSLFDDDLREVESAQATIYTSGGDVETFDLTASGAPGNFGATIALAAGGPVEGDGTLQALEDESIIASYRDADTGGGTPGDAVVTARVDCTNPTISNVAVTYAGGRRARISFTTSEAATGTVYAGLDCAVLDLSASGDVTTDHVIEVQGLSPLTEYRFRVAAEDPAGNSAADDNGGNCFTFTTTDYRDYLTQGLFDGLSDLTGMSVTFTPDGSASGYEACMAPADGFFTSPFCGEAVFPGDDENAEYNLAAGRKVTLFGQEYGSFFVNGNGYVTFGSEDFSYDPIYETHFALPRISGYFTDLYSPAGGLISVAELDDRVAISYFNVLDYYGDLQSFQIEIFDDGAIRLTWVMLTYPYGIVGLSDGSGMDPEFEPSTFESAPECVDSPYENIVCEVDVDNDACDTALPIAVGQVQTGATHAAMGSSEVPGCEYCYGPDVWYTFTPPTSDTYSVSLCGSTFDTIVEIFGGDCGGLEFVEGNDDGYCDYASTAVASLNAGETYWIRISGYGATTGAYELEVTRGAKASFGCYVDGGTPRNPWTEILIACGLVTLLAWRTRERRA